jgi:hypothetical protein
MNMREKVDCIELDRHGVQWRGSIGSQTWEIPDLLSVQIRPALLSLLHVARHGVTSFPHVRARAIAQSLQGLGTFATAPADVVLPHGVQTGCGAHRTCIGWNTGTICLRTKRPRREATTHLQLVPGFRMRGDPALLMTPF